MMWILSVLLVAVASRTIVAFPQNGGSQESFEVDGFVFDGPADRSSSRPIGKPRGTVPPVQTTEAITRATPVTPAATTASTAPVEPEGIDSCIGTCPRTSEYNPVCGTDNRIYDNPGHLNCAVQCGRSLAVMYYGPCSTASFKG